MQNISRTWVALLTIAAGACEASPSASGAASSASAAGSAPTAAPSSVPPALPLNDHDIRASMKSLGYSEIMISQVGDDVKIEDAKGSEGRLATVFLRRKPGGTPPGAATADLGDGRTLAVSVSREGKPDEAATRELLGAIRQGAGKTPRPFGVTPPTSPGFRVEDVATTAKLKPMFEKLGFTDVTSFDMLASEHAAASAHVDGTRAGSWAHVDVRCPLPGKQQTETVEEQGAGDAVFLGGRCLLVVGVRARDVSGDPLPEESRKLMLEVLASRM